VMNIGAKNPSSVPEKEYQLIGEIANHKLN